MSDYLSRLLIETEAGLYMNLINNFDYDLLEVIRKSTKIYSNVEQFVDEHVATEELKFDYFKPVVLGLLIWEIILLCLLYSPKLLTFKKNILSIF